MSTAPDYLEPVEGWRVWGVVEREGELLLRSLFYDTVWPYGAPVSAACHPRRRRLPLPWRRPPGHAAPREACGCGVHAAHKPSAVLSYLDWLAQGEVWRVLGRVALWGEVVECERGWRGSIAYPTRLYVPEELPTWPRRRDAGDVESTAARLAAYDVPVEIFASGRRRVDVLVAF